MKISFNCKLISVNIVIVLYDIIVITINIFSVFSLNLSTVILYSTQKISFKIYNYEINNNNENMFN